jgi:hypothetical protein
MIIASTGHPGGCEVRVRTAKLITDVLAPWVIIIAITAYVASRAHAYGYGVALVVGASLGPIAWIRLRVRRGSLTDIHVTERDQRGGVFAALIASLAIVTAAFGVLGAPTRMTALAATMLASLIVTGAMTIGARFKVSMHTAVATGAVVIAAADTRSDGAATGWIAVTGAAVTVAIAVARVVLDDHTRAQVVVGCVTGAACAGLLYPALTAS